jgi:CRP-like cAMP-binding protein
MLNPLLAYIEEYSGTALSPPEIELINASFRVKKVRRKDFFLRAGEVSRYCGFVVKGAMRTFKICDKGMEHVVKLAIENYWVGDLGSFSSKKSSSFNIDAREDTELYVINKPQADLLIDNSPSFALTLRIMEERNAISAQFRLNAYNCLNAEQRYLAFEQRYPLLFQRFPSHVLASFIGIQKETLSRIRNSRYESVSDGLCQKNNYPFKD